MRRKAAKTVADILTRRNCGHDVRRVGPCHHVAECGNEYFADEAQTNVGGSFRNRTAHAQPQEFISSVMLAPFITSVTHVRIECKGCGLPYWVDKTVMYPHADATYTCRKCTPFIRPRQFMPVHTTVSWANRFVDPANALDKFIEYAELYRETITSERPTPSPYIPSKEKQGKVQTLQDILAEDPDKELGVKFSRNYCRRTGHVERVAAHSKFKFRRRSNDKGDDNTLDIEELNITANADRVPTRRTTQAGQLKEEMPPSWFVRDFLLKWIERPRPKELSTEERLDLAVLESVANGTRPKDASKGFKVSQKKVKQRKKRLLKKIRKTYTQEGASLTPLCT